MTSSSSSPLRPEPLRRPTDEDRINHLRMALDEVSRGARPGHAARAIQADDELQQDQQLYDDPATAPARVEFAWFVGGPLDGERVTKWCGHRYPHHDVKVPVPMLVADALSTDAPDTMEMDYVLYRRNLLAVSGRTVWVWTMAPEVDQNPRALVDRVVDAIAFRAGLGAARTD